MTTLHPSCITYLPLTCTDTRQLFGFIRYKLWVPIEVNDRSNLHIRSLNMTRPWVKRVKVSTYVPRIQSLGSMLE